MNLRRIASLLRELADEIDPPEPSAKPAAKKKRAPRPRPYPAPLGPVSEVGRARAQAMLRRRGIVP